LQQACPVSRPSVKKSDDIVALQLKLSQGSISKRLNMLCFVGPCRAIEKI
jgi:hypothetical protein